MRRWSLLPACLPAAAAPAVNARLPYTTKPPSLTPHCLSRSLSLPSAGVAIVSLSLWLRKQGGILEEIYCYPASVLQSSQLAAKSHTGDWNWKRTAGDYFSTRKVHNSLVLNCVRRTWKNKFLIKSFFLFFFSSWRRGGRYFLHPTPTHLNSGVCLKPGGWMSCVRMIFPGFSLRAVFPRPRVGNSLWKK